MKRAYSSIIFLIVASALIGILQANSIQIVGLASTKLQFGNNRIEINFDAVEPLFSTLDMALKFEPADGVIGDEIMFPLDGKMRCYRFDSFDGTNYVLSAVKEAPPFATTLDAIPWMPEFWIKHNGSVEVSVTQSGGMGGGYERMERKWNRDSKRQTMAAPVVITLVDGNDPQKQRQMHLKGGHIRLGK